MNDRPSTAVKALMWAGLPVAVVVAVATDHMSDWDLALFGTLAAISIISDLTAVETRVSRVVISASFLTTVIAAVFLGGGPAAVMGVLTIVAGWIKERYPAALLLLNTFTYAWFPLIAGITFHAAQTGLDIETGTGPFYLLIFGVFVQALLIDFSLIAGYMSYTERSSFAAKFGRGLFPLLPSELASAMLAIGAAIAYVELGTEAVALLGILVLVFQYLIGALLTSQDRADELEVRARQLAGFQVALLSALLRTLDLRDRMTARHSAAVARYSREIAVQLGLPPEEQELVHSAALLHDIGKFVLPDSILKSGRRRLSDAEWEEIKKHPYEGARIVSQIDGYQPIGEIILAHHERIDGKGYPRGLDGEEIPLLARIISVADTYDVMTARDTYREPVSSYEAVVELRRVSGSQLDAACVEAFVQVLEGKDLAYRHGEDADFEAELVLDKRIHDYVAATPGADSAREPVAS
jgi:putative nucleotidyltransferase with HDIG domain